MSYDPNRELLREQRRAERQARRAGRRFRGGLAWGVVLIVIGVLLALDHWGLLSFDLSFRQWPLLLILLAAVGFAEHGLLRLGTHALLLLGLAFELRHLHYGWLVRQWWPLGLVWCGIVITLRAVHRPCPVESE